jgi:hypothetical protein
MAYLKYKKEIMPLCPVAVKFDQHEVHAPGHGTWGTVTCDGCGDKFFIGYNRIYSSRMSDSEAAKQFEGALASDHAAKRKHQDSYEIPD